MLKLKRRQWDALVSYLAGSELGEDGQTVLCAGAGVNLRVSMENCGLVDEIELDLRGMPVKPAR